MGVNTHAQTARFNFCRNGHVGLICFASTHVVVEEEHERVTRLEHRKLPIALTRWLSRY
jgi:hypothetical protein